MYINLLKNYSFECFFYRQKVLECFKLQGCKLNGNLLTNLIRITKIPSKFKGEVQCHSAGSQHHDKMILEIVLYEFCDISLQKRLFINVLSVNQVGKKRLVCEIYISET